MTRSSIGAVRKLTTRMVKKVWGRAALPPPFDNPHDEPVGEIWFEPPAAMPDLLVKYLFTSEKLSVQVHPPQDETLPGERGKDECWLVLDAKPGAKLAIGFDQRHSSSAIEAAARDGSIEQLLTWHEAKAGDLFYLPAGTVHAIGAGLALVEIQQASETTFRLFDYGRPRELHLERAITVADTGPYAARHRSTVARRGEMLIDGEYFRLHRIEGRPDTHVRDVYRGPLLALPLSGKLSSLRAGAAPGQPHHEAPDGMVSAGPGECVFAEHIDALDFQEAGVTLLTASGPVS